MVLAPPIDKPDPHLDRLKPQFTCHGMIRISKQADGVASTCEPQRGRTSVCVSAHDDAKLFGSAVVFILEMPVALLRGFVGVVISRGCPIDKP